ncbi:MAG TPA: TonB-dependent receptor [Bacteroidales bacterium]|nr:TonB-dependent receptor [Bacteroidales bacterium]
MPKVIGFCKGGLNYNKRHVNSDRSGVARILVPESNAYKHMIASGLKPEWYDNLAANLGFEKKFSSRSQLSGSYFYGLRTEGRIANYLYNNFFADINQNPLPEVPVNEDFTFNPNTGIREGAFNTFNLDYSITPDDESKLTLGAVYEYSVLTHDVDNPNISYDNTNGELGDKILHYKQKDATPLHGFRLSADYSRKLENGYAISLGLQPQFVKISGSFDYDTLGLINNFWGAYTSLENDIELNRFIKAGYADLAGQINKLNFKAGLRLEYTDQTLEIENPDYFSLFERPSHKRFETNKLDWFPSLHATYPISESGSVNFAASRRISRAPVKNMAPFLYRRHLEVYVVGDPELKPEYINTFELTFSNYIGEQQISLTSFYREVTDAVFRVNTVFEDELILIRTFTNAGQTQSLGGELNANFELGKRAKFYLGASLYSFWLQADIFGYREDHRSTNWNLKGNGNLMLSKQLRFVADFNIRSAEVTAQGSDKMRYLANAALVFNPAKQKAWTFNLKLLNILKSNTRGVSTRAYNSEGIQIFYQDADFFWYGPVAEFSVSYQFNWRNRTRAETESSFGKDEF